MIAVIFGIQGVGKSSVVKEVVKTDQTIKRIYWGELAMELAKEKYGITVVDDLRNITVEKQKVLQALVADKIEKIIGKEKGFDYIIETHAALKTRQGYFPGMNQDILKKLKPDLFIVMESDAVDIYHRRILDETRKREHDKTLREIQLNLDTTRWYASSFATFIGANLYILNNIEDNLDHAVNKILKLFAVYREE